MSNCKYLCIVYSSDIEFETGVPVANTMPLPPVASSIYLHFISKSADLSADDEVMPATLVILVRMYKFLNLCASSTNKRSTPSCSKVTTSSLLLSAYKSFIFFSSFFFSPSSCLIVKFSPF